MGQTVQICQICRNDTGKVDTDATTLDIPQQGPRAETAALYEPPPPWKPLQIQIVGARNLRNADFSLPFMKNMSDPYCICEIEGKPLSRVLTDVIRDNLNPVWNHEGQFRDFSEGENLHFTVWDRDSNKIKKDDFLGRATLTSGQFWPDGFDDEIQLQDAGKNRIAYLKIKIPSAEREARKPKTLEPHIGDNSVCSTISRISYARSAPSGNVNKPSDYVWLEECLMKLRANDAVSLNVKDDKKKTCMTPTLFLMGGCPNTFCGMQAVMFAVDGQNHQKELDFWWLKPSKENPTRLEKETLNRHDSGKHKNDPGRSRPFYQPLADLFQKNTLVGDWRFGLEQVSYEGTSSVRCTLRNENSKERSYYLTLLWQEDFTSNPFARTKFIKGKIMYQRQLGDSEQFYRQYEIHDGKTNIAMNEEGPTKSVIPPDDIKGLWNLQSAKSAAHMLQPTGN